MNEPQLKHFYEPDGWRCGCYRNAFLKFDERNLRIADTGIERRMQVNYIGELQRITEHM